MKGTSRSILVAPTCLFERRQPPTRFGLFLQQSFVLPPLLCTAGTQIVLLYEKNDPVKMKPRPPYRSVIPQLGYTMTTNRTPEWMHEGDNRTMYSACDVCAESEVT